MPEEHTAQGEYRPASPLGKTACSEVAWHLTSKDIHDFQEIYQLCINKYTTGNSD
jgi:hypothetical protein